MTLLIDSSIFIEAERRDITLDRLFVTIPDEESLVMSALTVSELLLGVLLSVPSRRRDQREQFIEDIIARVPALPFDREIARVYAAVWASLRLAGNLIAPHDLLIGSTALAHDCAVLTHNIRDFDRVPGLEVRQPAW